MKSFALPKNLILSSAKEFDQVFMGGKSFSSLYFTIFALPSEHLQVGFAVKRNGMNKPNRNRLKRRARELFRLNYQKRHLSVKMVIVIKPSALLTSFAVLQKEILALFSQIEKRFGINT